MIRYGLHSYFKNENSDLLSIENVERYCESIEEFEHFTTNVVVEIKHCPCS
jgi:hypothetical protein